LYGVPLSKIYKSKKKCNVEFYIPIQTIRCQLLPINLHI
jgi:hypothetical protein